MISQEWLNIPELSWLLNEATDKMETDPEHAAAGVDLSGVIRKYNLKPGFISIPHSWKEYSVQSAAFDLKIPFTGHPMFGHDIIYTHPMNHGAATGRTALIDFLYFARSVSKLDQGVYLSLGSSVMSPMIFENSISMAQTIEIQRTIISITISCLLLTWRSGMGWAGTNHQPVILHIICDIAKPLTGWASNTYLRADNRIFLQGFTGLCVMKPRIDLFKPDKYQYCNNCQD
jgi:hypothetical protein